jgi:hypothetical protein
MNRIDDLMTALPSWILAANASPPVEIAILDYNSQEDVAEALGDAWMSLVGGNKIVCARYEGRDHYHMAHAWNLAVKASSGEYIAIMGTDAIPSEGYVVAARKLIADGCVWMRGKYYKGIMVCQRKEFIDAGGYDERFEFYGGEDKDLEFRLKRRGGKFGLMPDNLVFTLRTSNSAKTKNFRLPLSKREMMQRNSDIRAENVAAGVLVANEGKDWGAWA